MTLQHEAGEAQEETAAINGPLRICEANPRYFTNHSGKAVYLTGSHTWSSLQDSGPIGKGPSRFDYDGFLAMLQENGHNFFRMWHFEGWCAELRRMHYSPMPYRRTGPETAFDGGPAYDLNVADYPDSDRFYQPYFDRLRERMIAASDRGIYAAVMLFQGWSVTQFATDPWPGHPFHPGNNRAGLDGGGYLSHTLPAADDENGQRILAVQRAYVRKVIDTVNDLDNVLYEIANEDVGAAAEWQEDMVRYIKQVEAGKPKRHPVGMTAGDRNRGATNAQLFGSAADWISPTMEDDADYKENPPAATGSKVVLADTDHFWGMGGDAVWVWKSFLRGLNPIYMDVFDRNFDDFVGIPATILDDLRSARPAMGDTRAYALRLNVTGMTPEKALSSTEYCLAEIGMEYLILQPEGGEAFTVVLPDCRFVAEWWSLDSRTAVPGPAALEGGGQVSFTAPFAGAAVLYLKRAGQV